MDSDNRDKKPTALHDDEHSSERPGRGGPASSSPGAEPPPAPAEATVKAADERANPAPAPAAEPQASEGNGVYYGTTPIFYVNAAPHIGHAYTTILVD